MIRLLTLLLLVATAHGQNMLVGNGAFEIQVAPSWTPATPATVISWWKGNDRIVDDKGFITNVPDFGPNGWALTNATRVGLPFGTNQLDGLYTMDFTWTAGTSNQLFNAAYACASQPHYICLLLNKSLITTTAIFWDRFGAAGAQNQLYFDISGGNTILRSTAGTDVTMLANANGLTNTWVAYFFVMNGASSTVYTNLVAGPTVNPGTAGQAGVTVGTRWSGTIPAFGRIAEIATYSAMTGGDMTNLFRYWRTKYPTASLPDR